MPSSCRSLPPRQPRNELISDSTCPWSRLLDSWALAYGTPGNCTRWCRREDRSAMRTSPPASMLSARSSATGKGQRGDSPDKIAKGPEFIDALLKRAVPTA